MGTLPPPLPANIAAGAEGHTTPPETVTSVDHATARDPSPNRNGATTAAVGDIYLWRTWLPTAIIADRKIQCVIATSMTMGICTQILRPVARAGISSNPCEIVASVHNLAFLSHNPREVSIAG